jgi:hypothetical protein
MMKRTMLIYPGGQLQVRLSIPKGITLTGLHVQIDDVVNGPIRILEIPFRRLIRSVQSPGSTIAEVPVQTGGAFTNPIPNQWTVHGV